MKKSSTGRVLFMSEGSVLREASLTTGTICQKCSILINWSDPLVRASYREYEEMHKPPQPGRVHGAVGGILITLASSFRRTDQRVGTVIKIRD